MSDTESKASSVNEPKSTTEKSRRLGQTSVIHETTHKTDYSVGQHDNLITSH